MIHTIEHTHNGHLFSQDISNILSSFKDGRKFLLSVSIMLKVFWLNLRSRAILKKLRKELSRCNDLNCLKHFQKTAENVRDNYIALLNMVSGSEISGFLKAQTEECAYDWDDMTEDFVVGTDPEFRSLISQIAKKA